MNIQQYYQKTASISLNASIISIIPPFFLIIYGVLIAPSGLITLSAVPFLIYSFICYQNYLINEKRSKEIVDIGVSPEKKYGVLLKTDTLLFTFMPAPTLRILIFGKEGERLGELKDMKIRSFRWFLPYFLDRLFERKYGLYDNENSLIAIFIVKKNRIEILDIYSNVTFSLLLISTAKRSVLRFHGNTKNIVVEQSYLYTDCKFYIDGLRRGRIQKGLMPLEWDKRFKDLNTPILSFEGNLSKEDKISIFAILTKLYQYTNH